MTGGFWLGFCSKPALRGLTGGFWLGFCSKPALRGLTGGFWLGFCSKPALRGLTGGFLLFRSYSVAISVSPHVCFILVFILFSMFLR